MGIKYNYNPIFARNFSGVPIFEHEVQTLLPEPPQAIQSHMDSHVHMKAEAAQEGMRVTS